MEGQSSVKRRHHLLNSLNKIELSYTHDDPACMALSLECISPLLEANTLSFNV